MIIERLLRPRDPAAEAWRFARKDRGLPGGLAARFAVTVFAILPLAATWPAPGMAGFFTALLAGFLVDRYLPLPRWVYFLIRFLAWLPVAYVFIALYWLDTSLLAVIGNTLAAWVLLYSFEATRRDYNFSMLMMGGLILLISSLLRRDGVLLAGYLVYALGFVPALADAAWHTVNNRHRARLGDPGRAGTLALFAAGGGGVAAALLLGGLLFIFVPRLSVDALRGIRMNNIYQANVSMFSVGNGNRPLDWRPVMRVQTATPGNYRGQVFVFYTGRFWFTVSENAATPLRAAGDTVVIPAQRRERWLGATQPQRVEFTVLPGFTTSQRYHLLAPLAVAGSDRELTLRPAGMLTATPRANFSYTALSETPRRPRARAADSETLLPHERGMYLQIPRFASARVGDLARQVAGRGDDFARVGALVAWLGNNCRYDLAATSPLMGGDMLDYFLFNSRAGWCEHFATALTILCRHAGLPARLVTGFAPGERDPADGSYLVRALHAHAWTEVYLSGRGWYTFDATPPGAFPGGAGEFFSGGGWQFDWPDRMLKFIDSDQGDLQDAALSALPLPNWFMELADMPLTLPLFAAAGLLLLLAPAWFWWRRHRRARAPAPLPELIRCYDAVRRALVAAGARDEAGWTPAQFAAQPFAPAAAEWRQIFAAFAELTPEYYRCRFAGDPDHGLLARLRDLAAGLPVRPRP